jgi:hypothetical protein
VDFLVEHPLDTIELVREVGEALPQGVEGGGRHGVVSAIAKKEKATIVFNFFCIVIWISKTD